MRAVAAEAGVSLGLLNYHFAGKQALIAEAVQLACDRLLSDSLLSLKGVVGADDRVRAFIRGAAADEFLSPEYLRLRLVIWAAARLYPDIGVVDLLVYQEYVDRMEELIGEAVPASVPRMSTSGLMTCPLTRTDCGFTGLGSGTGSPWNVGCDVARTSPSVQAEWCPRPRCDIAPISNNWRPRPFT